MTHTHKCGFAPDDMWKEASEPDDGDGCGNIFSHGTECMGREQAHMCPDCGRGPWYEKYQNALGELNPRAKRDSR